MSRSFLKSIHRRALGINRDDSVMAPKGLSTGGDGYPTIVLPSWNTTAFFDDFYGIYAMDTGSGGRYYNLHGTDTGGDNSLTLLSGGGSGVLRMAAPQNFPVSNGGGAPDMQGIVLGRNFTAGQGRVRLAARLRNADTGTTVNGVSIFCGFTDDTGTTEVAFYSDTGEDNSSDTGAVNSAANGEISAKATNAVGWLFDTAVDTGSGMLTGFPKWCGVAVNAGTVAEPVVASSGVVPNIYDTVELEIDQNVAHFWLNGVKRGTILSPLAASAKLAPVISITGHFVSAANTNKLEVDYWNVSANRDTGT